MSKREAEADAVRQTKEGKVASGRSNGMSGRDLFTFNPNLGVDSDDEEDGGDGDDFDLIGYRAETTEQHRLAEDERIRRLGQAGED